MAGKETLFKAVKILLSRASILLVLCIRNQAELFHHPEQRQLTSFPALTSPCTAMLPCSIILNEEKQLTASPTLTSLLCTSNLRWAHIQKFCCWEGRQCPNDSSVGRCSWFRFQSWGLTLRWSVHFQIHNWNGNLLQEEGGCLPLPDELLKCASMMQFRPTP